MKTLIATCLIVFLANIAFANTECPMPGSALEIDLLLTEGPAFVHQGAPAGECLGRVIKREKALRPHAPVAQDDRDLVHSLMTAAWKAEVDAIEHAAGIERR